MIFQGDCKKCLSLLESESIDAFVTDPPYGLSKEPKIEEVLKNWRDEKSYKHGSAGFMGKTWDSFVPNPDVWREVYRTLRPGGYCLAFAGSRTQGLMGHRGKNFRAKSNVAGAVNYQPTINPADLKEHEPVSLEAQFWNGWGTALKPSHEPIIIACKPYNDGSLPKAHLDWPLFHVHSKSSQRERNKGCEDLLWAQEVGSKDDWQSINEEQWKEFEEINELADSTAWHLRKGNIHPTVKPVGIMRWLIDLLPDHVNVICDPFMGSGTTGIAAKEAKREFIGVELNASSVVISTARIAAS